jgi:hypothetical protein
MAIIIKASTRTATARVVKSEPQWWWACPDTPAAAARPAASAVTHTQCNPNEAPDTPAGCQLPVPSSAADMLPVVTAMFIQCRNVRSLAAKRAASTVNSNPGPF